MVSALLKSTSYQRVLQMAIVDAINPLINVIRERFLNAGVDAKIVDECLGSGPTRSKTKIVGQDMKNKPKLKAKITDVVIIKDYGKRSHAVFGDFKEKYVTFKDEYLKPCKFTKANGRLAFGFGWVIMQKDKLEEVQEALEEADIPFRTVSRAKYEKEMKSETQEISDDSEEEDVSGEEDGQEEEDSPPKVLKKKALKKKAPAKKQKLKAPKNKYGNNEESVTGFVFKMLPVGANKKKVPVAIGIQDHDPEDNKTGLSTLLLFDEEENEECKTRGWGYLTEDMIQQISKVKGYKKLAKELKLYFDDNIYEEEDDDD